MRLRAQTFDCMLKQEIGWFDRKENSTGTIYLSTAIIILPTNLI